MLKEKIFTEKYFSMFEFNVTYMSIKVEGISTNKIFLTNFTKEIVFGFEILLLSLELSNICSIFRIFRDNYETDRDNMNGYTFTIAYSFTCTYIFCLCLYSLEITKKRKNVLLGILKKTFYTLYIKIR